MIGARPETVPGIAGAAGGIEFHLHPLQSLPEAEKIWRGLESGGSGSFFTSWLWIGSWLACLPERIRALLLTANGNSGPIGAAILVPKERGRLTGAVRELHFNSTGENEFDNITIEHNGFVGAPETDRILWPPFLRWFAQQQQFDRLLVPGICHGAIETRLHRTSPIVHETVSPAYACALPRDGDREEILGLLSSNSRQQLRRNIRAWEKAGPLRCERADTAETALLWFEALRDLHIDSWTKRQRPHAFRHPFFEVFHRTLIARGVGAGAIDLLRISAGSTVLGYLYNFRSADRVLAYQSGFDENLSDGRPGYVSHFLAMQMSARENAACYDFLAGSNRLKQNFSNGDYVMSSMSFARAGLGTRLENALLTTLRALRS